MEFELITQLGLATTLAAYIWNDAKKRNEKTETKVENLDLKCEIIEKRVQKVEDIQGSKIDMLTNDFKEFKHDISQKLDALTHMVHRDINQENALNKTLGLLLKELQKKYEHEDNN